MNIVYSLSPEMEIYSIDEAFVNLKGINNLIEYSESVIKKIKQYTGIPVSIGIAKTKTLAKVANKIAKKLMITMKLIIFFICPPFEKIFDK